MIPKRPALPSPPGLELASLPKQKARQRGHLESLLRDRSEAAARLGLLDRQIERLAIESICGLNDLQQVEQYDGTLGVTRALVDHVQGAVGQLQWLGTLAAMFTGPGDSPGNVAGVRWGSGGLISNNTYITAGHCLDSYDEEWKTPKRADRSLPPSELAPLMQVVFNYQINGTTGVLQTGENFPVLELLEHRSGGLDYTLLRLGKNSAGRLPGEVYGVLTVAAHDLTDAGAMLCLIQHPDGQPKQIEAGPMKENVGGRISYASLDTLNGSSGAPILSDAGEVVGVHTSGGCTRFNGENFGVAIGAIRAASVLL